MQETQHEKSARALKTYASLTSAVHSMDSILDKQCDFFGLSSSQYRVLEHLLINGPMATGDLATRVLFADSTMSVVAKNLEHAGYLVRRADAADGRKAIVHLTEEGRKIAEKILPKRAKVLRAKMCALGKREQENLERLCQKLAKGDAVGFLLEMTAEEDEAVQVRS